MTHLLPFPLRREYRQKSSVHGSPLNGAHTHQSPGRRQPLNNAPLQKIKGEAVERKGRLWVDFGSAGRLHATAFRPSARVANPTPRQNEPQGEVPDP